MIINIENLGQITLLALIDYLRSHESDIAHCVNDYGDLTAVFIAFIGRNPQA